MLIHRKNSHTPRGNRRTGHREVQNRGTAQQIRSPPYIRQEVYCQCHSYYLNTRAAVFHQILRTLIYL
jgi:hypothetical protein